MLKNTTMKSSSPDPSNDVTRLLESLTTSGPTPVPNPSTTFPIRHSSPPKPPVGALKKLDSPQDSTYGYHFAQGAYPFHLSSSSFNQNLLCESSTANISVYAPKIMRDKRQSTIKSYRLGLLPRDPFKFDSCCRFNIGKFRNFCIVNDCNINHQGERVDG